MSNERALAAARSMLFVPGDRPDRFPKAASSGADLIVLDLEDAVAPAQKASARAEIDAWLASGRSAVVRINGFETSWYDEDVALVAPHGCPVMLPKAHDRDQISQLAGQLPAGSGVIALVETAAGVLAAGAISTHPAVARVAFGSVDLAAELDVDPEDWKPMLFARSALVMALASAGAPAPIDGVTTVLDVAALRRATAAAARLGFAGKLCIHPDQVSTVNRAFAPSAADVARARRIVGAAEGTGVTMLDGQMVDKPVVQRARRLLAKADGFALRQAGT
ncbi:HpcH/HpaI aldolase/citrate lyase family protein [Mycobacterium paraintracellulare]|uniref:Citryl-CoA lyase n=1 Tax=Mycobacterium paraintracellulare TaxID=1138383 RepID=A0ABM7KB51_9MYCO|nr:CoA ester lyase [Mycobacterium paraintracellulare]AFC53169.1 citrate lyase [Mycobacterium paraintracellulare]OSC23291.1 CoA ester lyase [Mycobacterium paraintracellulare]BBY71336.1 citryl-CoA lyase [Mycobacterium paraintracellulare]